MREVNLPTLCTAVLDFLFPLMQHHVFRYVTTEGQKRHDSRDFQITDSHYTRTGRQTVVKTEII